MDRTEKIVKLQKLNALIGQKKLQSEKEKKELNLLEEEYKLANISELPILLFLIDEHSPIPEDEQDWKYEYIYYFPDLDQIGFRYFRSKNELLPNTIDLTENFKDVGIPNRIWPGSAQTCTVYRPKIMHTVSLLKSQIDSVFASEKIDSWSDLATHLIDDSLEKGQSKILKPNNSQK